MDEHVYEHYIYIYIYVAYLVSHATKCHVQLVLCNYTNVQLHVSHATEF
jgi:hypothetical protein